MSDLRALVWDVDGTLAETERDGHRVAFNRAFEDEGLPWRWDVATYGALLRVTGGKERIRHWWRGIDANATDRLGADDQVRRLHERKTAHYAALVRSGRVALRPGVQRLLNDARAAGLVLAIATTTTEANVHELLDATLGGEARAWFAVIGAGDVVARKKPAPDIYRWVLERLRLPPEAVLAIEDSVAGAASAQAAAVPVLLTRGLYSVDDEVPPPLLADLDGLGTAQRPARGRVGDRDWSGCVEVATLRQWHRSSGT